MKHNFFKKLTALLLGAIMVISMIPAIAVSTKAAEITVSVTIGDYAKANGWADSKAYKEIIMDDYITVTASGSGNTAKYYNNGSNWRFYQTDKSQFSVTAKDGATIQSVKVTYSISNTGVMTYNGANKTSNSVITVNGTSATFGVGNTGTKTNGQVRVTAIQVVYSINDSGCQHEYTDCEDAICNLCEEERTAPGHAYDSCEDTTCNNAGCGAEDREAREHEYSNECDATCNNCSATREITPPAADSTLTLDVANELGLTYASNTYTSGKYYVTGVISRIVNTTYGNLYIKDENGTEFYVYGVYSWGGDVRYDALAVKPAVGDTITLYGTIGSYSGAAQMKNAWIYIEATECEHTYSNEYDASCDNCGEEREVTIPSADSILDILTINKLGIAQGHNGYTEGKYYVVGTVKEITSAEYGNMTIVDANGNEFTVYGSYDATGENSFADMANPFKVGDTVQVYGVVGQYGGTAQIKNGWVTILPKFEGFGLTLNKGITIRVKLTFDQMWIDANPDVKIIFTDAAATTLDPIAGTNYYSITLTPGEINRIIKVSVGDITEDVSVAAYIAKAKEKYADDTALIALLNAIEVYGNAAAGETAAEPNFEGVDNPTYDDAFGLFGGNLTIDAVLNDYANIGINVNATENLAYTISLAGKTVARGADFASIVTDGKLVIENLRPANFNDDIVLTVTNADGEIATATFSFNAYLKALYELDNEYKNIAAATYNYGVAVEAYQNAQ